MVTTNVPVTEGWDGREGWDVRECWDGNDISAKPIQDANDGNDVNTNSPVTPDSSTTNTGTSEASATPAKINWKYALNPCDIDALPFIKPIGAPFAKMFKLLTSGTDCTCCLGMRVALLFLLAFVLGIIFGKWV